MFSQSEKRSAERTPCNEDIKFYLPDQVASSPSTRHNTGTVIDICATGMGLSTTSQLEKGQIIHFVQPQPKWSLPAKAIIVWALKLQNHYRVGLEFILQSDDLIVAHK